MNILGCFKYPLLTACSLRPLFWSFPARLPHDGRDSPRRATYQLALWSRASTLNPKVLGSIPNYVLFFPLPLPVSLARLLAPGRWPLLPFVGGHPSVRAHSSFWVPPARRSREYACAISFQHLINIIFFRLTKKSSCPNFPRSCMNKVGSFGGCFSFSAFAYFPPPLSPVYSG